MCNRIERTAVTVTSFFVNRFLNANFMPVFTMSVICLDTFFAVPVSIGNNIKLKMCVSLAEFVFCNTQRRKVLCSIEIKKLFELNRHLLKINKHH